MKKLFGLGTVMAAGAGLMYWLLAVDTVKDWKPEPFVCSENVETKSSKISPEFRHCQVSNMSCGVTSKGNISCVKRGLFF